MSTTPSPRPFAYADNRLTCSGSDLTELADTYGTPLYVYSADAVRERVDMLQAEFATVPNTLCYAVKANSSLAILKLLGQQGCGFDIVSGGELERVRRAAPAALSRVVFSGSRGRSGIGRVERDVIIYKGAKALAAGVGL